MKYNQAKPTIKKDIYLPTNEVILRLDFPNEEYLANTWGLSFDVLLEQVAGTPIADATNLYIDSSIGANSMIGYEQIKFETTGDQYTNGDFARVEKMKSVCNVHRDSQASESFQLTQLKCSDETLTNKLLATKQSVYLPLVTSGLNNLSGNLRSDVTGTITATYKIEDLVKIVFGPGANATNSLQISNILGHYVSVPLSSGKPTPVYMGVYHTIQQKVNTGSASISTNVPSQFVESMSCTFLPVSDDSVYPANQNILSQSFVPNRVQWNWNNTTDQYIEYPIETRQEMLQGFVESMGGNPNNIKSDNNFGLGIRFPTLLDLRNKSIGLQLESNITSASPFMIYMVFYTYIQI